MPSRRDILRLAGLAAVSPQAAWAQIQDKAKKPKPAAGTVLVNDVHAQLSSARVFKIEQPVSLDGVRKAFALAKEEERPVCIAGGRHSMGGQPFVADGVMIDVRKLNKVLAFNDAAGLIEVESGVMWPQLLEYLVQAQRGRNPQWTFSQKQAGADRLTMGGSVSANIHGRGLTLAPFIDDIESLKLVNHRGDLVPCS
ncbi:MAG: FAD-dependent oxidoreductase, partial [Pseudomonadota bacterium]|nr:FAD-dependent oxidoreductase [Pseudomonadota bacterium]